MKHSKRVTTVNSKPCLFCTWAEDLEEAQKSLRKKAGGITVNDMATRFRTTKNKPWKSQFLEANEHFFAILSKENKVEGHTLIISRKHFWDITDPLLADEKDEVKIAFFDIATEIARKLANLTQDNIAPKVYVMSICEHLTTEELDAARKSHHTEHLHFHLLPRIKAMRTRYPYYVPESMFVRCDGKQSSKELKRIRQKILNSQS